MQWALWYNLIMKTIATISTPIGRGAIAIVRMSGDNALEIASRIFTTKKLDNFSNAIPNYMYYGKLDCQDFSDAALAVYFKAPNSYTGEDVVEFQCHGGVRLINEVLKKCIQEGCVPAGKGEFTKRAFLNGKMALSDAEGIIDMINSESIASLNAGYRLSKGEIAQKIVEIQTNLLDCISELEASLDYPEEMEEQAKSNAHVSISSAIEELEKLYSTSKVGEYIKQGINVAIIGQANVGKSSLLNALLGRERAIVTDIAGTTRDSLEEYVEVQGIMLKLIDTAGIRDTEDAVERIGVDKAKESAKDADLVIYVTDASVSLDENDEEIINMLKGQKAVVLLNKTDLDTVLSEEILKEKIPGKEIIPISAKENKGIDLLEETLKNMFFEGKLSFNDEVYITNMRHKAALIDACESLRQVESSLAMQMPEDFYSIDLMAAYESLGSIIGEQVGEDLVDEIFGKFCMGK